MTGKVDAIRIIGVLECRVMGLVDIIILAVILLSVIFGLFRGLVREAIALATWVLAFLLATRYAATASSYLARFMADTQWRQWLSWLFLFVATFIVGVIVNKLLSRLVSLAGLGAVDKLLGAAFGFGRAVLAISVFLAVLFSTPLGTADWLRASRLVSQYRPLITWVQNRLPLTRQGLIGPQSLAASVQAWSQMPTDRADKGADR